MRFSFFLYGNHLQQSPPIAWCVNTPLFEIPAAIHCAEELTERTSDNPKNQNAAIGVIHEREKKKWNKIK